MIMMPYNCSSHRCSSQAVQTSGTPQAILITDPGELLNIGGDLGLQRRGQHLPGAVSHDLSVSDDGCPSAGSAPATSGTTVSMGVPSRPGVPASAIA
jgi:hypothetical protein